MTSCSCPLASQTQALADPILLLVYETGNANMLNRFADLTDMLHDIAAAPGV